MPRSASPTWADSSDPTCLGRLSGGLLFRPKRRAAVGRRKIRHLGQRSDQEAFLKAWLTLRVNGAALSPANFVPRAVSSLICSLSIAVCFWACAVHSSKRSDDEFAVESWRANSKTPAVFA